MFRGPGRATAEDPGCGSGTFVPFPAAAGSATLGPARASRVREAAVAPPVDAREGVPVMRHLVRPVRMALVIPVLSVTVLLPARGAEGSEPGILVQLREEAARLAPWVETDLARGFLKAVEHLAAPEPRTLYRTEDKARYWSSEAAASLPEAERKSLEEMEISASQYYTTKYGSPLAYVRAVDLLAGQGLGSLEGQRILDFGYGTVGHLRLMAHMGADAVGVDIDPFLPALYSRPGDQGAVKRKAGPAGKVTLVDGQWPAHPGVREAVGSGFDLFISKNTLKRGYVHPERKADPRRLVHLGVEDAAYVDHLFRVLEPGGLAIIYNLSPPQNPPDKTYIPWADGRCPFDRGLLERVGFQVIAYDTVDDGKAREMARKLGWDEMGMDPDTQLFAHYTILRKPAGE